MCNVCKISTTRCWLKKSSSSEIMSQSSTLSVYMVKERLPKYCYLNLSDDDDEETLDLLDQINFKILINVRDAVDEIHDGAVDTDSAYSDTCSDDYFDDNDVNSDDDGRQQDDPIEKNEANGDFQRKIDAFKPNGCRST